MKPLFTCIAVLLALAALLGPAGPLSAAPVETETLIVSDPEGELSAAELAAFAARGEQAMKAILAFWDDTARIRRFGKIRLQYYPPRARRGVTVFHWRKEAGRRVRVVSVWGSAEEPEMMVHKLTTAVYPNRDKLVRNMMGVPTEERLGVRRTSPMCGFATDAWVLALRRVGFYVPLREFGPDHESWGMGTRDGLPYTADGKRRHAMYAESGSFGLHLIETYGVAEMKKFNALSVKRKNRPWMKVFGHRLGDLEARWIAALETKKQTLAADVARLAAVLEDHPSAPCIHARGQ